MNNFMKRHWCILLFAALFLLCILFPYISFWVTSGKNAMIAPPDAVQFNVECDTDGGFLTQIEWDTKKKTYHIEVPDKYLDGHGYAYVTGSIWNYPFNPIVHINGEECPEVDLDYFDNLYHFYIRDIEPDKKYRVYVRCADDNDYINLYFHKW